MKKRRPSVETACDLTEGSRQSSITSFFGATVPTKKRLTKSIGTPVSPKKRPPPGTPPSPRERGNPGTPPSYQHRALVSTSNSTTNKTAAKKRPKMQQLLLDCGQRNFGQRTVCSICGMLYVDGDEEDQAQHQRICSDYKDGVRFKADAARVVRTIDRGSCIVEVTPSDKSSLRKKVAQVRKIVDADLGYVADEDKVYALTTYLYVARDRVVGMTSVEAIRHGFLLQDNHERSTVQYKALIGVHQIWVHSKYRHQGIASRLVDAARSRMVYGLVVPATQVAFSSPTQQGAAFARSYVQEKASSDQVLVYECY